MGDTLPFSRRDFMGSAVAMYEPSSGLCFVDNVEVKELCSWESWESLNHAPVRLSFTLLRSNAQRTPGHDLGRALPQ